MGQFDFNAALVLVRVVQAGSFRAAAEQLGMPKTTVSRKVSELEAQLGAVLLQRTTRRLSLTDAGLAFMEEAEAAIAVLRHATTVAPADAEVHHHLGNALKSLLRHAEARPVLTRARDLAPNDAVIRLNLGATLLALGAPAEAIAEFEVAVAREPRRAEAHNILGCALLAASRIGDAVFADHA